MYAGGAGEVEGSWSVLQQQALAKYLYAEQQAHWLLMLKEKNQANSSLCNVNNDVIISDWVRTQSACIRKHISC